MTASGVDVFVQRAHFQCAASSHALPGPSLADRVRDALAHAPAAFDRACVAALGEPIGVVIAERLALTVQLSGELSHDEIASAFGAALGSQVRGAVALGQALHFPDRAVYVARCLIGVLDPSAAPAFVRRHCIGETWRSVVDLLAKNRDILPGVLVELHRRDHLHSVLMAMPQKWQWFVACGGLGLHLPWRELREWTTENGDGMSKRRSSRERQGADSSQAGEQVREWTERMEGILRDAFDDLANGTVSEASREHSSVGPDEGSDANQLQVEAALAGLAELQVAMQTAMDLGKSIEPELAEVLRQPADDPDELREAQELFGSLGSDVFSADWSDAVRETAKRTNEGNAKELREAPRALFETALRLLDRLGVVVERRAAQSAFRSWSRAERSHQTSWSNSEALARDVADAVDECARNASCRDAMRAVAPIGVGGSELQQAMQGLDWLDMALLESRVVDRVNAADPKVTSPRLSRLHDEVAALIGSGELSLDHESPTGAANSITVFAALVAKNPEWRAEPSVATAIAQALVDWAESSSLSATESAAEAHESDAAGLFLVLRGLADLGMPKGLPDTSEDDTTRQHWLASVGLCLVGVSALDSEGQIDPAVCLWAGLEGPVSQAQLQASLSANATVGGGNAHASLIRLVRRALRDDSDEIYWHEQSDAVGTRLVGVGGRSGIPWFHQVVADDQDRDQVLAGWRATWVEATGADCRSMTTAPEAHVRDRFLGLLGSACVDTATGAVTMLAAGVLCAWSRWLRGFEGSSSNYLLEQFVLRSGTVVQRGGRIEVDLHPRPLDLVLEQAGYFANLDGLSWLPRGGIVFRRIH